jgi:hypothetical protein
MRTARLEGEDDMVEGDDDETTVMVDTGPLMRDMRRLGPPRDNLKACQTRPKRIASTYMDFLIY